MITSINYNKHIRPFASLPLLTLTSKRLSPSHTYRHAHIKEYTHCTQLVYMTHTPHKQNYCIVPFEPITLLIRSKYKMLFFQTERKKDCTSTYIKTKTQKIIKGLEFCICTKSCKTSYGTVKHNDMLDAIITDVSHNLALCSNGRVYQAIHRIIICTQTNVLVRAENQKQDMDTKTSLWQWWSTVLKKM